MPRRFIDATPYADCETYMRYALKLEPQAQVKEKGYRCAYCGEEFDHEPVVGLQLPFFPNVASHGEGNYRLSGLIYAVNAAPG